jgi:hypothetical protein
VIGQHALKSDKSYKCAFIDFIKSRQWHWFITIPIGLCDDEEEVLKRLRSIEATLCGKYLVNRYHKLPDEARYSMVVAFEGEARLGTRHAHILAYVPKPINKRIPQSMLSSLFAFEFRFLWNKFSSTPNKTYEDWIRIKSAPANTARTIYTVKELRQADISWSRFAFVTPPKFEKFRNENLSVIRNRDRQRSAVLGIRKSVVR